MPSFHLTLMHREAIRRLDDAKQLIGHGDSAHLLSLLGFELLLKLVHEVTLERKSEHGHRYDLIFSDLPTEVKDQILKAGRARIGISALTSKPMTVFKEWGNNFIQLRYPYEKYEGLTEEEYLRQGAEWVAAGAPLEEAQFRYYPEELYAMLEALREMTDEMAKNSFRRTTMGTNGLAK